MGISSLRVAAIALVLGLAARSAPAQTTWYVDAQGSPPGSGTASDPYTDLDDALDRTTTVDGDTVLVRPGNYVGPISTSKLVDVRSTDGPAATRILGNVLFGTGATFPRAVLQGFTIRGGATMFSGAIDQCAIVAPSPGGNGIFLDYGGSITRCTIAGFTTGIVQFSFDTDPVLIENTVLSSLDSTDINATVAGGTGAIRYCRLGSVSGAWGWQFVGNVHADAGLWDPTHGYVRLKPGSPCIDAGDPAGATDPDGSRADMGVFAYDGTYAPRPTSYCAAKPNSQGCLPHVVHQGECSAASSQPFLVNAVGVVPNRLGFLFYGSAEAATPFQGGTRCVTGAFKRTPATSSGSNGQPPPFDSCSGVLSYDFNARIRSGVDPALVPGRMVFAQYYYRDPADPAGFRTGLSDGLRFGIAP